MLIVFFFFWHFTALFSSTHSGVDQQTEIVRTSPKKTQFKKYISQPESPATDQEDESEVDDVFYKNPPLKKSSPNSIILDLYCPESPATDQEDESEVDAACFRKHVSKKMCQTQKI